MNKPAAKEPSMDEILSSIRQIIADEDQETAAAKPETTADEALAAVEAEEEEPLALSPDQMVEDTEEEAEPVEVPEAADLSEAFDIPEIADADASEEIDFSPAPPTEPLEPEAPEPFEIPEDATMAAEEPAQEVPAEPEEEAEPGIVLADDIAFDEDTVAEVSEPAMQAAAPMPDPTLSADMAEKLLEPTTSAATKHAFSRLNQLSMGAGDMTIENMVREMLKPMLKEWLDENLPSVVEKLVEREIERISRGS